MQPVPLLSKTSDTYTALLIISSPLPAGRWISTFQGLSEIWSPLSIAALGTWGSKSGESHVTTMCIFKAYLTSDATLYVCTTCNLRTNALHHFSNKRRLEINGITRRCFKMRTELENNKAHRRILLTTISALCLVLLAPNIHGEKFPSWS